MNYASSPGPWGCHQCGTDRNFAWRSACRQCGKSAPNKWLQWQKREGKKAAKDSQESWPALGSGPERVASKWWGPQTHVKQEAPREPTAVERCVEFLALAKNMDDPELVQRAEGKLAAARAQRDAAVAPSIRRDRAQAEVRRLESRVVAKQKLREQAGQELAAAQEKCEKAEKELSDMAELLSKAQGELAAAAKLPAVRVSPDRPTDGGIPADIAAAVSEVQRLQCVVQSLSTTSQENLPAVGESLRAIVAALVNALPQASNLPVTQHETEGELPTAGEVNALEVDDGDSDDDVDEFLDSFEGLDADGSNGSGHATDQRRTQLRQFLAKNRTVKVKGKQRQHG